MRVVLAGQDRRLVLEGDLQMRRIKKCALLAALSGATLFGGCLGLPWKQMLWDTALYVGQEFVLDNANVFNLFPDTTAQ
jgi:hypothetical protein